MKKDYSLLLLIIVVFTVFSMTHSLPLRDLQIEVVSSTKRYTHNKTSVEVQITTSSYSVKASQPYNTNELISLTKGAVASRTDWLWKQADKWTKKLTHFFTDFDLRSYLGLKGGSKGGVLSIEATIIEGHKLQFTVTNNYRKAICVQKVGLLLDNKLWPTGVRVWKGDKQIPQASFSVPLLLKKIREKNFIMLDSGESITVTRDLTDYFIMEPKTRYVVEIISFVNYFKKASENSCKVTKLSIDNSQVHKWRSSAFQLNSRFTHVWKKRVRMSGWVKENQKTITQASKQLYVVSKKRIEKKGITYLLQVHTLTLEALKGAVNFLQKISENDYKKSQQIYKRWFGEIDKKLISQLIETYNKIIHGITKVPLIYTVCKPCQVYAPIFVIPFHTMSNKGIPLLNLCSGPSSYYNAPINSAVFDTIRGLAHLYADTSHTYKPLLDKPNVNLRQKVAPIAEKSHDKAYKTSENIAIFAMESVSQPFKKVTKEVLVSSHTKGCHSEAPKKEKEKNSLRSVFKKLKQKFTKGH